MASFHALFGIQQGPHALQPRCAGAGYSVITLQSIPARLFPARMLLMHHLQHVGVPQLHVGAGREAGTSRTGRDRSSVFLTQYMLVKAKLRLQSNAACLSGMS